MSAPLQTGSVVVDGVGTFFRRLPGDGPPTVFVHGVPTHSEEWIPFLERMQGPALAFDLPGFGRSERPPPERFDYSVHAYAASSSGSSSAWGSGSTHWSSTTGARSA